MRFTVAGQRYLVENGNLYHVGSDLTTKDQCKTLIIPGRADDKLADMARRYGWKG